MCKEVSLAVSHRIFKWKKVSNGKFGKKTYSSAMYFILEVEVVEILTTLCLCNETTDRKVNTCRRQLKKNQGGKNILIVMPSGFCYKWTCWTFSWCQKKGWNLVLFMFQLYLLTLLFQCFHSKEPPNCFQLFYSFLNSHHSVPSSQKSCEILPPE